MKTYSIRNWDELFENSRSRVVKDLDWVAVPNKHDGENFSIIMQHEQGAVIFAAWVLMLQVASKCRPRGILLRDNRTPHTAISLSAKCRCPVAWFTLALEYLENNTDWLDAVEFIPNQQQAVIVPSPSHQEAVVEGKGREGKEGKGRRAVFVEEVFNGWNEMAEKSGLPKTLAVSDSRRRKIEVRSSDNFFVTHWRQALEKVAASAFCHGSSERGWRATFDWFIQPDSVPKIVEGKYDNRTPTQQTGHAPDAVWDARTPEEIAEQGAA